jgi:hypothetical protein
MSDLFTHAEQTKQIARVSGKIAESVMDALRGWKYLYGNGHEFRMSDLVDAVNERAPSIKMAPDSAGRILRMLRQDGQIDYVVVNRAQSLYRLTAIMDKTHEG